MILPSFRTPPPNSIGQSPPMPVKFPPLFLKMPAWFSERSHGCLGIELNFNMKGLYQYWSLSRKTTISFLCKCECAIFFPDNFRMEIIFDVLGKNVHQRKSTRFQSQLGHFPVGVNHLTFSHLMFLSVKWECCSLLPWAIKTDCIHKVPWFIAQCLLNKCHPPSLFFVSVPV